MRYYEASPAIASSPEAVRADGTAWDSGADGVDSRIAPGQKITIRPRLCLAGEFPVKMTDFEPSARLRISGGMPLNLFRGVRAIKMSPDGTGGTVFDVREECMGPLPGLTWRSMPDPGPSFGRFARGLKCRAGAGH
jgi:hypothetical protein